MGLAPIIYFNKIEEAETWIIDNKYNYKRHRLFIIKEDEDKFSVSVD